MKRLTVGLLASGTHSDKYVYELALWASAQPNIRISHLIVHSCRPNAKRDSISPGVSGEALCNRASKILLRLMTAIESSRLKRISLHGDHDHQFDLRKIVPATLEVDSVVSASGLVYRFSDEDIEKIRALECDVLVRCGSGELKGGILDSARLGIISFKYGDDRMIGGEAPAGFWEWYFKWPKTGFVIQRLTEDPDRGEILVRGFFRTEKRFLLNQALLYKKANHHLQDLLARVGDTDGLPEPEPAFPYSGQMLEFPRFHQSLAALAKLVYRYCENRFLESINLKDKWGMSFLHSDWRHANLGESIEVKLPPGRSWNVPFLYTHNSRTYCFVEVDVFKRKPRRGYIAALEITTDAVIEIGACLEEPFHLAFPFLFDYNGSLYMCPEAGEAAQIRVYRCTDFPLRWELCSVIKEGAPAANTMIFQHHDKWWLLTNIDRSGTHDSCSELYLFFAESPLDTDWKPHPKNPVRIDSDGGRNAGLILERGRIFRLGQRHSYDVYGEGVIVFEITELSESTYLEQPVTEINASFRKGLRGIHHCSTSGTTTVVDHASRSFVF
jgi:hypothetical protein